MKMCAWMSVRVRVRVHRHFRFFRKLYKQVLFCARKTMVLFCVHLSFSFARSRQLDLFVLFTAAHRIPKHTLHFLVQFVFTN